MANILIIDDEDIIREMLRDILEPEGHTIIEAENGHQGLEKYDPTTIELVITDIMMPEKDGIETIRDLKKCNPEVLIVAITGYRGRFNRLPAAEFLGAQETLIKPFTKADLLTVIDKLLKNNEA